MEETWKNGDRHFIRTIIILKESMLSILYEICHGFYTTYYLQCVCLCTWGGS